MLNFTMILRLETMILSLSDKQLEALISGVSERLSLKSLTVHHLTQLCTIKYTINGINVFSEYDIIYKKSGKYGSSINY